MPVISMACPKCGKQATEYAPNKWQCLYCGRKFLYEETKAPIINTHVSSAESANINTILADSVKPAASYRAIHPLAVASVPLGALSILTVFGSSVAAWLLLTLIPLAGVVLGWIAVKQIRRAPDVWTGRRLAWLGIGLSVGLWALGCCWLLIVGASEVPYGYQWVSYESLQPDPNKPTEPIPQTAIDMQDRKVYIKGFMQPRRQQAGIKDFILCPSNGECPFCTPSPKRTEMIRVRLQGDLETSYTTHLIGVAGRFRVEADDPSGIPYAMDAEYVR